MNRIENPLAKGEEAGYNSLTDLFEDRNQSSKEKNYENQRIHNGIRWR